MSHHAAKTVRLQPIAHLMFLLCLVSLGFVDRGAVAQELVGQAPRRMTMDLTLLTVEQERVLVAKPGSDFKECANGCPVMIVIPNEAFASDRRGISATVSRGEWGLPVDFSGLRSSLQGHALDMGA